VATRHELQEAIDALREAGAAMADIITAMMDNSVTVPFKDKNTPVYLGGKLTAIANILDGIEKDIAEIA